MNVLFLDQFSEMGGAQHALLDTVDAVERQGWHTRVLLPGKGPLVEALRSREVSIGEIPCGTYRCGSKSAADLGRFALDLRGQRRVLWDELAQSNIDLMYVNGPRLLPAAALAARGKVPLVFHVHNHLHSSALRLARWILQSTATTVLGCSNSVLEPFRRHIDASRMHVIPNGVRDAGYRERAFDFRSCPRIGMIGRIAPEKGQLEFVNAALLLKDEFPHAHFVICGESLFHARPGYFDAVRLRARDLPVEFTGWREDVGGILHEFDLLAVPSHAEGMGRIVLEAFSAGVPVVAFPAGGIPEAILDGVTGFLTRDRSGPALAARIREVLTMNPCSLARVAREARQAWGLSYSLGIYQDRITTLLEALVSQGRAVEMPLQHK